MSGASSIEWCDATWNPTRGCSMAAGSEAGGCLNCFAARQAARNLPGLRSPKTGKPFARMLGSGPRWTGEVELIPAALDWPLHRKKPLRIFVNSMSDLFHERLSNEAIAAVFGVMAACPQHTFQVLTKRPGRMVEWFRWISAVVGQNELTGRRVVAECDPIVGCQLQAGRLGVRFPARQLDEVGHTWPLPNVWLGVSVENQSTADARIPLLLQTPAARRFVSYEPALGPVDFSCIWFRQEGGETLWNALRSSPPDAGGKWAGVPGLDWIIVGGESGPGARPFDIAWARSTVEQCRAAGVPCFVKQLGARPVAQHPVGSPGDLVDAPCVDRKGGDWNEWPEDLRVREFPA